MKKPEIKSVILVVLAVVLGVAFLKYTLGSPSASRFAVDFQRPDIKGETPDDDVPETPTPPVEAVSTITTDPAVVYPVPRKVRHVSLRDGRKILFSVFPDKGCKWMMGHALGTKYSIADALNSCAQWPICQSITCKGETCNLFSPSCTLANSINPNTTTFVIEDRTSRKLDFGPLRISKNSFGNEETNSATETAITSEECKMEYSRSVWENMPKRTSKKYPYTEVTLRDYKSFRLSSVIPQHKIVFFRMPKVMSTNLLGLADRMLGHRDLVIDHNQTTLLHYMGSTPARPRQELRTMTHKEVNQIMNDPTWKKVLFLRDPVERLLSCYLDKFMKVGPLNFGTIFGRNATPASVSFPEFVSFVGSSKPAPYGVGAGTNPHYRSQFMVSNLFKFLPHFDQIGWGNTASAEHVLRRYGLWEQYSSSELWPFGFMRNGGSHPTGSTSVKQEYYDEELSAIARKAYDMDYALLKSIGLEKKTDMPVSGLSMMPLNSGCCGKGCVPVSLGKDI
eukprot:TRINITY_DN304_c0_g1_i1.p1 TRINITY_DN304_c0_g1~~TRINITY_DN304_c0_g1_i1.p1  ORF type:complete len:520 (+),score=72.45 TRINITY_DN304_c0_g1_i1:42-1562(+)